MKCLSADLGLPVYWEDAADVGIDDTGRDRALISLAQII